MYYVLHFFFPFLRWIKQYRIADLKADAFAGLTVALVLVPQSMANAQLAGLPAYHGLYAALIPVFVGGIWGSSKHLVTGTGAVISIMAAAALEPLSISSPAGYIAYMALLTLIVGGIQLLLGVFRMGIVVNFLSLPVIAGFTNAAAIIIAASQVEKLFGVTVDSADHQYQTLISVLKSAWYYAHIPSILMALLAAAIIFGVSRFAKRLPAVLLAVVVTTTLSWALGFENDTKIALEQIKSKEAEALIIRLDLQTKRLAQIAAEIASLEKMDSLLQTNELEIQYRIDEQILFKQRSQQDIMLVREHLRRMLFVAVEKDDGSREFYAYKSPGIVPGTTKVKEADLSPHFSMVLPAVGAAMPAQNAAIAEVVDAESAESVVSGTVSGEIVAPATTAGDGKTWRLLLGKGALDTENMTMSSGGSIVGSMPSGLPHFYMPNFSFENMLLLLPSALIIAFVGFAESISIAKSAANKKGYRLDANQELVGQGLANISGGLILTCPVSGSFSNSAVNISAGARTGISCVFAALGALMTLLFFTGALQYLPKPVLAVIIIRAVGNLVSVDEFRRLWTAQWFDGCIALITFVATLFFAPHLDFGIGIGVALSLVTYFYRSMNPRIASLSCGPDNKLHDAQVFGLEECRHIGIVHFQGDLFFANAGVLEDHILRRLETQKNLRHIHLVCSGITSIDASGEDSLAMLVERANVAGVEMSFSGVVGSVGEVLERTGVLHMVGWENVFLSPREAICAILKRIQHDADCRDCPLSSLFCRSSELEAGYNVDSLAARQLREFYQKR